MSPHETQTPIWRRALTSQFGAALDMFANAIRACPEPLWDDPGVPVARRFWYLAYHTLFWLDRYLEEREEAHVPPPPYTLGELDPAGVYPERTYTREELLDYLAYGRERCRRALGSLDEERAGRRCGFARLELTVLELHLYSCRHVQHHTAQLQLLLRQGDVVPPRWVGLGKP